MIPKFEHRFPGLAEARLSSSYAGCYDVTPDYNPMISASPVDGLVALRRVLGARLQDLPIGRRAHGRPHHRRGAAGIPTSTTTTSAGSGSPTDDLWSARIPTPAQGRCAECTGHPGIGGRWRHILISRGHSPSHERPRRFGRSAPRQRHCPSVAPRRTRRPRAAVAQEAAGGRRRASTKSNVVALDRLTPTAGTARAASSARSSPTMCAVAGWRSG